jgi:beta-glucosidase
MTESGSRFPEGFVWGAATAAFQIEGAVHEDGRQPSIWDTFSRIPGKITNGDTADVATDHYHRVDADVRLMADLGLPAYRFSVAWPRIVPTGSGRVNGKGIDFYSRLVDRLLEARIQPILTLYHWDLPQQLENLGGWTSRDTAWRFAAYAEVVAKALGDRVPAWTTLNEPWCSAIFGYGNGWHAPGIVDQNAAFTAAHHLLLAHGLGVRALRDSLPATAAVGITTNHAPIRSRTDRPEDVVAARHADGALNRLFLDPIFRGEYPSDIVADTQPAVDWGFVRDGDLAIINGPIDFLGVNYYAPSVASGVGDPDNQPTEDPSDDPLAATGPSPWPGTTLAYSQPLEGLPRTAMGWPIEPSGLTDVLTRIAREYTDIPLYVTENGAAFDDIVGRTGEIDDLERISYLQGHIQAVADAISAGVDVRGYFVWSLMDNFEWAFGYTKRFGLLYVDYDTLDRTPKASARWYRSVILANGLAEGG